MRAFNRWHLTISIVGLTGAIYAVLPRNNLSHSELFDLKRRCLKLAEEFAGRKHESSSNFEANYSVIRSDYDIKRQTCFGEFDKNAYFPTTGEMFAEHQIYDLLTGHKVAAFTYIINSKNKGPDTYALEAGPKFEKAEKEIFGSTFLSWLEN